MTTPAHIIAARAAYRLGVLDALLHPDMIDRAYDDDALPVPSIVVASLTGEREHRIAELRGVGIALDVFDDLALRANG